MARTNATDVKVIIDTDLSDSVVTAIINDANLIVTEVFGSSSGLSSALLTSIEKWLTAHMIAMSRDRQASRKKIGDAENTYGKTGLRLDATSYGQMVLSMDSSGRFADVGKRPASIVAITSFQ